MYKQEKEKITTLLDLILEYGRLQEAHGEIKFNSQGNQVSL